MKFLEVLMVGDFDEKDKYCPNSPYSASKASADMLVRSFNKTYGLNTTISISSNNFGENQHSEKFIPKILNCILNNLEIPVYGDGNNIRDWIYVMDNCHAIDLIFNNSQSGDIYNVGSGTKLSNLDLINIISKILSKDVKLNFVKDRKGHDFRYSLNTNKIKRNLGWDIQYDFQSTMRNYLRKFKN